jgi:uncharacterized protein
VTTEGKTAELQGAQYISLTTFRRSGAGVATPVWFALDGTTVYVETGPTTGKMKRIRHTPKVTLAPCSATGAVKGQVVEGVARILESEAGRKAAQEALGRKYGWTRRLYYALLNGVRRLARRPVGSMGYVAIEL